MAKEKSKTIPQELYIKLFQWSYVGSIDDEEMKKDCQKYFEKKVEAEKVRNYYTLSKTAATPEEREEYRKKYLDAKGIPESFRW